MTVASEPEKCDLHVLRSDWQQISAQLEREERLVDVGRLSYCTVTAAGSPPIASFDVLAPDDLAVR